MTIRIIKSCSVRLNGEVKKLNAGESINLPPEKAQKMIDAGYAEDIQAGPDDYQAFCQEIMRSDPGGECWSWIYKEYPELWQEHITAFRSGDISLAKTTFTQMVKIWNQKIQ
jgi:hypothetical protein